MDTSLLDIAEVAKRSDLAPSALRFYEKKGLIAAAGRNGLRRTYHPDVLERLTLITCARSAGFSIAEISRFLLARPSDADLRTRMTAKAHTLDEQISRLTRLRDSLRHAAVCDHEPIVDCPDFKRAVGNVATRPRRSGDDTRRTRSPGQHRAGQGDMDGRAAEDAEQGVAAPQVQADGDGKGRERRQ